jgi:hypothetical protein
MNERKVAVMTRDIKIGDCYFNPHLVPFKVLAFMDGIEPLKGEPFDAIAVEFAWQKDDYESTIEIVERSIVDGWTRHEKTRLVSDVDLRCLRKYKDLPLELNGVDRESVKALWNLYGNAGSKYTHGNHEFLRCYLEGAPERAGHFQPTDECILDFKKVLDGDYSMLPEGTRKILEGQSTLEDWLTKEKEVDSSDAKDTQSG